MTSAGYIEGSLKLNKVCLSDSALFVMVSKIAEEDAFVGRTGLEHSSLGDLQSTTELKVCLCIGKMCSNTATVTSTLTCHYSTKT